MKKSQHLLNELHIYCRLRTCKMPKWLAKCLAGLFGWVTEPFVYRKKGKPPRWG